MVNPNNLQFMLLKTQGEGTQNGQNPMNIMEEVSDIGDTYTDSTNRVSITRVGSNKLLIVFSGLFFELAWINRNDLSYGNVQNLKILEQYSATGRSRGIMGSSPFQNCELPICL